VTFSVLALLIVGLQLMLMLMLNGDQAGGPRNSDQQQGPRNRVEKMVASHRRSKNKQASLHRGKILGITLYQGIRYPQTIFRAWSIEIFFVLRDFTAEKMKRSE
jgi:hypothetical protein